LIAADVFLVYVQST